jgi:hypothetical protein
MISRTELTFQWLAEHSTTGWEGRSWASHRSTFSGIQK